ncbi:HAD family hydrolase [Pseudaquabacterium rugosum]|uniref:HAD-IA family hydrolase n=1 Tax=Pseudaquabacterium rugosum TaxID=2984194 RepID=A0ABU9BCU1_9BURK
MQSPPEQTFDAIIFDCDGTLVDSEPPGFAGIIDAAQALGLAMDRPDDLMALKGRSMIQVVELFEALAQAQGRGPLPADIEERIRAAMRARFERELQLMPGARELLTWLDEQHIPWVIASNGPRSKMHTTLGLTGLLARCEHRLISAVELGVYKPDPQLLLHAAQQLGVDPTRCVMVEDSAPGVRAALGAGMTVCVMGSEDPLPDDLLPQVHPLTDLQALKAWRWAKLEAAQG